jgi:endonuclease G
MKTILFILLSVNLFAQDTLIDKGIYKSFYSFVIKAPIYVSYKLYKGGGDCSREGMSFKNEHLKNRTAVNSDYDATYDRGHLADAESWASNCTNEELTFRYWNCFPQTPELNRGIWKTFETKVRNISQSDSILVICGGFYSDKTIGRGVAVPDSCWKLVQSLTTKKILFCKIFTNTTLPTSRDISFTRLNIFVNKKYKVSLKSLIK